MVQVSNVTFICLVTFSLQVQNPFNPKYSGTIQGLKSIWASEGIRGFFKGNGTNCARIIPNSAVKFYSYEQASRFVPQGRMLQPSYTVFNFGSI